MSKTTTNPFEFAPSTNASTGTKRLDFTPALIEKSNNRATELMMTIGKKPELFDLANKAIDGGNPQDLIDLINAVFNDETIKTDATILTGCPDDQLGRLLESRRSDRSKAKRKGPRSNVTVCRTYISSMYAEILIREFWNKPYTGAVGSSEADLDLTDLDAIGRKVKSLQSKKSRLKDLAKYNADARKQLEETEAEIARLNSLRPTVRTAVKTVVKDIGVDQLRDVLKSINPDDLPEDEQAKLLELMKKLG